MSKIINKIITFKNIELKQKKLFCFLLGFVSLLGIGINAQATTTSSISQYNITWTFDKEYEVGQFANGDWWVVGPVTIIQINPTPAYDYRYGANTCRSAYPPNVTNCTEYPNYSTTCVNNKCEYAYARNGFEINPTPGSIHGYDDRAPGYSKTLNQTIPIHISINSSIVSAISNPQETMCVRGGGGPGWYNYLGDCTECKLETAAVLTIVGSTPPNGSFRPAYAGSDKILYSMHSLQRHLLLNLASAGTRPSFSRISRLLERVWLDHKTGWSSSYIAPMNNKPGYGADIASDLGVGALMILSDIPPEEKEDLLIKYLQIGIDLYGILKSGGSWPADGGHAPGRKFPILFAGLMLNDAGMKSVGVDYGPTYFGEDCQTYYDDDPNFPAYHGILGFPRWGIRHCQDPTGTKPSYHDESSGYRICCNSQSWQGQALAARLLKMENLWNHQAYFDYEDRWTKESNNGYHASAWSNAMWQQYRPSIDTCTNEVQDTCANMCNQTTATFLGEEGIDCGGTCYSCHETVYGDIDSNGAITAYDAALTAQAAVGLITLTSNQVLAADVDGSGTVIAYDAALIARKAVGLLDKFPVEL